MFSLGRNLLEYSSYLIKCIGLRKLRSSLHFFKIFFIYVSIGVYAMHVQVPAEAEEGIGWPRTRVTCFPEPIDENAAN